MSENTEVIELLKELRDYPRLKESFGTMLQKSQCILLWAFSKDPELADRDYLTSLCKAMLNYEGTRFELDNFDLLLVVQAISHIERSEFGEDPIFMNDFY